MKAFLVVAALVATACSNEQNGNALAGGGSPDSGNIGGGNGMADARVGTQLDGGGDARVGTGGGGDAGAAPDARSTADAGGGVISVDAASLDGGSGGGGTGPSNVPAFTFTSGTRIRARVTTTTLSTADGASYSTTKLDGWFDRELNMPCDLAVASDLVTRCLPTNIPNAYLFLDSRCTIRFAIVVGQPPPYIKVEFCPFDTATCISTRALRVFSLGEQITPGSEVYSLDQNNHCGRTTVVGPSEMLWYKPTASEVPPTQFAEMRTTVTTTTE